MTVTCIISNFPKPPIACTGPLRAVCLFAENHVRGAQMQGASVGVEFQGTAEERYYANFYLADVFLELVNDLTVTVMQSSKVKECGND